MYAITIWLDRDADALFYFARKVHIPYLWYFSRANKSKYIRSVYCINCYKIKQNIAIRYIMWNGRSLTDFNLFNLTKNQKVLIWKSIQCVVHTKFDIYVWIVILKDICVLTTKCTFLNSFPYFKSEFIIMALYRLKAIKQKWKY